MNDCAKLIDKKLAMFKDEISDLIDDFAFNEDGDILVKDIKPLMTDVIKIMQIEIECVNI